MELSQQTGDAKTFARSLTSLGLVDQVRGNLWDSERKLEEAVQISRRKGYKDSLAQSLVDLSAAAYWQGHFERAIQAEQESLSIAREIHEGLQELRSLAYLCLACWGAGHYAQALKVLHEGMTKAKERNNIHIPGRLTNTLGWFHREFGDLSSAVTYDQESIELGRTHRRDHVEISASINLGLDYLAVGQCERALAHLEPTLDRVQREAFGAHRWRWTISLLIGLANFAESTHHDTMPLKNKGVITSLA